MTTNNIIFNNIILDLVLQHLPVKRKQSSTGIYINCPMCTQMGEVRNDVKFRGGFTQKGDGSFIYHCHNCNYATGHQPNGRVSKNLMKFLTTLGIQSTQVPIALRLLQKDEKLDISVKVNEPDVIIEFDEIKLPKGSRRIEEWAQEENPPPEFLKAITYLHSRGSAVFNGWQYYWTADNKFSMNQRIIIPFFHHSKIVGYTARRFTDNEKLSKYYGKTPQDYMFNQDKLENDDPFIFLVEGILDAVAIKGVAVLGNNLTEKQINLLNQCKKDIILVPDRNKAGEKLLEQVLDNKWYVSIPDWDTNVDDVARATKRYGRLYTLESIMATKSKNVMAARIKFGVARL